MVLKTTRVLLVEDNPHEALLIRHHLTKSFSTDYRVQHAHNIGSALSLISFGEGFDVVVLDLHLPDTDGLDGYLRLTSELGPVPVLILTNFDNEEMASRAVRLGAQDYLIKKEINAALLNRAINYAIERNVAEQEIKKLQERYALAIAGANDCIWDCEPLENTAYFSPRWQELIGEDDTTSPASSLKDWTDRIHPDQQATLHKLLNQKKQPGQHHFELEHRLRRQDDNYVWVLARGIIINNEQGETERIAGSICSIEERKKTEHQLIYDALHDSLTGLPNRALFLDRLNQALRRYRRDPKDKFATLYFDLDRFKFVNDSLGHNAGDDLLVSVSKKLLRILRPGDTVARLGGDEFALLLLDIVDKTDATIVADRIHELFREEFTIAGRGMFTSASIGIAFAGPQYDSPEDIMRDADLAMYRAKRSNNQRTVIFDSTMHSAAVHRLTLETDLRRAFERNELLLHYQPIVSLVSGRITAFEALLRWQHPDQGVLLPDTFISVAQETHLLEPISWWVMEQAFRQTRRWQTLFPLNPPIGISINVSARLFRNAESAKQVLNILQSQGLTPTDLRLEMTEHDFMDHEDAAHASFETLRQAGVNIHMDDFGTGYSSLSYLQKSAYDSMKIDKSFVANIETNQENTILVETIVALGKMLNMNVVAEGVESDSQVRALRRIECPEAQGYWFSHPVPAEQAGELLHRPMILH